MQCEPMVLEGGIVVSFVFGIAALVVGICLYLAVLARSLGIAVAFVFGIVVAFVSVAVSVVGITCIPGGSAPVGPGNGAAAAAAAAAAE